MPSAIQKRKSDPVKELRSEINACLKELNSKRREVLKLEAKLESLLDKHLEHIDRMVK